MLAILIVLDCYRIGWVAWGLQRITDTQSTLQSKKSPFNPQNPVAIENRVIKDCGRILWLVEDHFSTLFSPDSAISDFAILGLAQNVYSSEVSKNGPRPTTKSSRNPL